MKKVLAMVVAVVTMAATGVAQKPKPKASGILAQASPAVTASGATTQFVPVFTDSAGDLGDSLIFENSVSGNIGIGTATPLATLDISGTNPALRVDNYSDTVGDSPNFNFYTARGSSGTPGTTQAGDNLGQFAATGFNGAAFGGSKVKVTFVATDTWSATDNGTGIGFQTTANSDTTLKRTSRMFIDNTGNVGIGSIYGLAIGGSTPPPNPLSVNGVIQSASGGFLFPNGNLQAVPAYNLAPADTTLNFGGTATAPTVAVNTAVVQARVINCAGGAITQIAANGTATCATVGPSGTLAVTPTIVATVPLTGGASGGSLQTIYTAPANGYYRVSVYMYVTLAGSCATPGTCAGEAIFVGWDDGSSATTAATSHCDLTAVCGSPGNVPLLYLPSGKSITAQGGIYAGTGGLNAPTGSPTWASYVVVEQM